MKTVCFFGIYNPEYARNRVLMRALSENGYEIVECRVDPRSFPGVRKYTELIRLFKQLPKKKYDLTIVAYPGQSVVWLAWLLFGRSIVFDAFLSLYDSNVDDRKIYSRFHPRAFYDWVLDFSSCLLASKVLLDTNEHIEYFRMQFFIHREKLVRLFISADDEIFSPRDLQIPNTPFVVHFHGMFIPLQGMRYIIEAANILKGENIIFQIVGSGQEFAMIEAAAKSQGLQGVRFIGKVPLEEIPTYVAKSHVCLGIFGDTEKTKRVIPNKVYEYAAMGKPIITADTKAIREVFTNQQDVILCAVASGKAIAEAVMSLQMHTDRAKFIGDNAYKLFLARLQPKILGEQLLKDLNV